MDFVDFDALGDDIALVEVKLRAEHVLTEPHTTECIKQAFVKVICHTATILNLPKHIAYTNPIHTLEKLRA